VCSYLRQGLLGGRRYIVDMIYRLCSGWMYKSQGSHKQKRDSGRERKNENPFHSNEEESLTRKTWMKITSRREDVEGNGR
jgi:hypothetical protein